MDLPKHLSKRLPWEIKQYLHMGVTTYRGKVLVQASFLVAAVLTGIVAVYFYKGIDYLSEVNHELFVAHPILMSIATPAIFLAAVAVVRFLAPEAGGSGVPQVLYAAETSRIGKGVPENPKLVSVRTATIKVVSTALGFFGGASIGGEGPIVQIAASIFAHLGKRVRKLFPKIDYHSFLVAGAGAGIAAAFNTPLGGLAFAIEEVAVEGGFGKLRHLVLLAVIVTGLTAQALVGNALYFGHPGMIPERQSVFILWAVVIGVVGGAAGGLFGRIASTQVFTRRKVSWWKRALICGVIMSLINITFKGETAGSGYAVTRHLMATQEAKLPLMFPLAKLFSTAISTLSGMGGGILSPSLTIGAWLGVSAGKVALFSQLKVCAVFGMVAYFTGAFQVPITALIIVMEMTDEHALILPMMVAALCAFIVGKLIMPESLYHVLIHRNYEKHAPAVAAELAAVAAALPLAEGDTLQPQATASKSPDV